MAVKTYSYYAERNKYVSKHTQVKEFASESDGRLYSDLVLIDTDLLDMVEKLFAKLNCSKYIVVSGYRTPTHDKKVGGNGKGQHTLGKAVDARFYDSKGKVISSKIVCCVAQELGFKGIANISKKYQNVHLDVRSSGKYYGDEIKGTNTVTGNFYEYFGVTKAQVAKYTGEVEPAKSYFKKYTGTTSSIVTALKSIGATTSFSYRSKIAKANGISGYIGTAKQNTTMLNLLKKGALIKP